MNSIQSLKPTNEVFSSHSEVGNVSLVKLSLDEHSALLHCWVNQSHSQYWGLRGSSVAQVKQEYQSLLAQPGYQVYVGLVNQQPCFLLETYNPVESELNGLVTLEKGDRGLHLLISKSTHKISGFSFEVMAQCMHFIFNYEQAERIIVEPDQRNHKIHHLNRRLGFVHHHLLKLSNKVALWGTCDKASFELALTLQQTARGRHLQDLVTRAKTSEHWSQANRHLVAKMISEWLHENILVANRAPDFAANGYVITAPGSSTVYYFRAETMALNHWQVAKGSIEKHVAGSAQMLDAVKFVIEFNSSLAIPKDKLPTYLEEVTSTLLSYAFKVAKPRLPIAQLALADLATIEAAMIEGHPCFVANNGRIGFSASEFLEYAPEAGQAINLVWLAIARKLAVFSARANLDYEQLIAQELDPSLRLAFENVIINKGKSPQDYFFIPVHPWQWQNKIATIFAGDLALEQLIYIGAGEQGYQPQQSIRTLLNVSQPQQRYVKTSLSILNMGFVRGLSAEYMAVTPAINDWLTQLLQQDDFIEPTTFTILHEEAAIGYRSENFAMSTIGPSPYSKMLSALWRENPYTKCDNTTQLMSMAALLHVEPDGSALVTALIKCSGLSAKAWLAEYLKIYLTPLLHCFYRYQLVFMPHGENLILGVKQGRVIQAFMKDIGEEICLLNSDRVVPQGLERLKVTVSDEVAVLSIFTDVFDGFLRFLAALMVEQQLIQETEFWQTVAQNIQAYQQQFPELGFRFEQWDLFAPNFLHSCLNRLQLRNNFQMVNLADPAEALQFSGTLVNPIAAYRNSVEVVQEEK